jgi:hypothetical protein
LTGKVVVFDLVSASGEIFRQPICPIRQTRIFNTKTAHPGLVVIRAVTLDVSETLNIDPHTRVKRKRPWLGLAQVAPV